MQLDKAELLKMLEAVSYKEYGDYYERSYCHLIQNNFPNSELFWRNFVVPQTKRIQTSSKLGSDIRVRPNVDEALVDINNAHYSLFMNLSFARTHLLTRAVSSVENAYTHLGSACDLAEEVVAKFYLLLLRCRGAQSDHSYEVSRDQFLKRAAKRYDESYKKWGDIYLRTGKTLTVRFHAQTDLLSEYLSGDRSPTLAEYRRISQSIRTIRNLIVHSTRLGRIVTQNGDRLIPKSGRVDDYRDWRSIQKATADEAQINRDFREEYSQVEVDATYFEEALNKIWNYLVEDLVSSLFDETNSEMLKLYDLEFDGSKGAVFVAEPMRSSGDLIPGSGIGYLDNGPSSGGSAVWPSSWSGLDD
ncbi:MAG: hypothetical protein KF701_05000 [Anaerolineales bacterium]|nr:MAG: hypothetical protein KF701_05000 [Anaerolineales bacterium]